MLILLLFSTIKIVKKFIFFVFTILAGVILASKVYYSPCDTPIEYRIDKIDPQFGITREEFLSDVSRASTIWEQTIGKDLFAYNSEGDLAISLVYDERQSLTNQINQLEGNLDTEKISLQTRIEEYQRLSAGFEKKISDFNSKVEYWNQEGGAPKEEFDKLVTEQEELKKEADSLNEIARSLNQSTKNYNTEVGQLNQTVDTFNQTLKTKPEQGLYNSSSNTIDIYFSTSKNELIHTIAHELGHARGLTHVTNSKAIMYSFTSNEIVPSLEDIRMLNKVCKKRTILELSKNTLIILLFNLEKAVKKPL